MRTTWLLSISYGLHPHITGHLLISVYGRMYPSTTSTGFIAGQDNILQEYPKLRIKMQPNYPTPENHNPHKLTGVLTEKKLNYTDAWYDQNLITAASC